MTHDKLPAEAVGEQTGNYALASTLLLRKSLDRYVKFIKAIEKELK